MSLSTDHVLATCSDPSISSWQPMKGRSTTVKVTVNRVPSHLNACIVINNLLPSSLYMLLLSALGPSFIRWSVCTCYFSLVGLCRVRRVGKKLSNVLICLHANKPSLSPHHAAQNLMSLISLVKIRRAFLKRVIYDLNWGLSFSYEEPWSIHLSSRIRDCDVF